MISRSAELDALDRRHERRLTSALGYEEALARFAALWAEARDIGVDMAEHWRDDLEPDLAVAQAISGLPPSA